jgi:hypothetical protein
MALNGMGFRAIERVTGVNHNSVLSWVRQATPPSLRRITRFPKRLNSQDVVLFQIRRNANDLNPVTHLLSQASSDSNIYLNHSLLCNAKNSIYTCGICAFVRGFFDVMSFDSVPFQSFVDKRFAHQGSVRSTLSRAG